MSRTYTPDDIRRILLKHRWVVLLPFAVGLAIVPLLAPFAPERYRSETLIMVVPQRVPEKIVTSTVTQTIEDRLPAISEQILSRSRLERIIQEMDLYQDLRRRQVMEDVVQQMRGDVTVSLTTKDASSFRVGYVSDRADTARKVTERLASLYIEQNVSDRESQAEATRVFIENRLEEAKKRLIEQEQKLEAYSRQHAGQLPAQLAGNLQAIQNASLQLQAISESTNRALERRLVIERQMMVPAVPLSAPIVSSDAAEAPISGTPAQQLELARARLAANLRIYTPAHPEVVSLERLIADLTVRVESETPVSATQALAERPLSPAEEAQRKKVLDLQADLAVVDHQLTANKNEDARLRSLIASYQAKVDAVPSRESELVELMRDYSTLQEAYASLWFMREESQIAEAMERRQIGEQIRILDPASLPERPFYLLQRVAFTGSGAAAGLVLGLAIVGLIEYRNSSFRREEDVYRTLSLPVLAMVPVMSSDREQRAGRRRRRLLDLAGTTALVVAVVVVVVWRLQS
jgi:polysaccharide chain length determinant protein (PEP-CTERM system associated)